jgi:hypothetical protein
MNLQEVNGLLPLLLAAIAAVVWLVRLESRINAADKTASGMEAALAAANARAEAEAKAHRGTADSLIRVEEQLKYVRELLERHFVLTEPAPGRVRRSRDAT